MMANIYTGQVQGVSLIATGTPAAFCRKVSGGELKVDMSNVVNKGIGGTLHVRKGTSQISLSITCVGVESTFLAYFFPTTAGVTVANFPDFLVECDDGSTGQEWVLSNAQPKSVKVSCSNGEDAEVEYEFEIMAATVTPAAAGTDVPVYNGHPGFTINDVHVQVGAADVGVMSFDLSNDLGTKIVNTMDLKASGSKTMPTAVVPVSQDVKLSFTTTNSLGSTGVFADDHTLVDVTIAMDNGATGAVAATLHDFVPRTWNMPLQAEDVVAFAHEYEPGGDSTIYNRVTFA